MKVQLKKSDIIESGTLGMKKIFSIKLPNVSIKLPINDYTGVANRKCLFLEENTMCVHIDVGLMGYMASADALITMNEMGYNFEDIDDLKRAKKEKAKVKELYLKLIDEQPALFESSNDDNNSIDFEVPPLEKEKSKHYRNLNIDLKWLENEIVSYHSMKNHPETSIYHKDNIIYIQIGSGRWAFGTIVDGTPNNFKVSTGPLKVIKAKSAGFIASTVLVTGGIGLAAKAVGAASDKLKGDQFMKFIDEKIYQNKDNGPESAEKSQDNNNSNNSDDIPSQIKKLSDLKDQGILTEEEFNTKKTDLLSKM